MPPAQLRRLARRPNLPCYNKDGQQQIIGYRVLRSNISSKAFICLHAEMKQWNDLFPDAWHHQVLCCLKMNALNADG
jgi:hypothetical protein